MREIIDDLIKYYTVDGQVKLVMTKSDYEKLRETVYVCDEILENVKLGIFAEVNEALKFNKKEMEEPILSNYCLLVKLSEKQWKRIKQVLKQHYEEKFKGEENE